MMPHPAQSPKHLSQSGSALLVVVVALIPVAALVVLSLESAATSARDLEAHRRVTRASNDALSAVEMAKGAIALARYDAPGMIGRNDVLGATLMSTDNAILRQDGANHLAMDLTTGQRIWTDVDPWDDADDINPYRRLRTYQPPGLDQAVDIWVVQLNGLWCMLEAEIEVRGVKRTARALVREFDSFARYSIFTDQLDEQPISVQTSGDVHSNNKLHFMYGGWDLPGYMSAVAGFSWELGADWTNVGFLGGYDETSDPITLPSLTEIRDRMRPPVASLAGKETAGDYIYIGTNYTDCTISLLAGGGLISAYNSVTSSWEVIHIGSLANVRRIYVVPNISSLKGSTWASLSIASEGTTGITITDHLRYIDQDWDRPYTDVGVTNKPNPDYDGNAVLGVIAAAGSVIYGAGAPATLEVHASIFAAERQMIEGLVTNGDTRTVDTYDATYQKDYLLTHGSSVTRAGKFRGVVSATDGTRLSGFEDGAYLFDESLSSNPPPYFAQIPRPVFMGIHLVEAITDI